MVAARGKGELQAETSITFFVEGGESQGGSLEVPTRIALTPDRTRYRVGDIARLRVESPITGVALLTTETSRVHDVKILELSHAQSTLEVPVTADLLPHGYVTLTVVRSSLDAESRSRVKR